MDNGTLGAEPLLNSDSIFSESIFQRLSSLVIGMDTYDQLAIQYEFAGWKSSWPKPPVFDPKYPSGGAADFPYFNVANYRAMIDTFDSSIAVRAAYNNIRMLLQTDANLKLARQYMAIGEDAWSARELAVQSLKSFAKDPKNSALIAAINSHVLPKGIKEKANTQDTFWWSSHDNLGWTLKAVYGLIDATLVLP